MLLGDPAVQAELAVTFENATSVSRAAINFQTQRRKLANQSPSGLRIENTELTTLLHELDSFTSKMLTETQLTRLRQIAWQDQLPFTFKTAEISSALALTSKQVSEISKIIEETRPGRGGFPMGFGAPPPPPPNNTPGRPFDDCYQLSRNGYAPLRAQE